MAHTQAEIIKELTELMPIYNNTAVRIATLYARHGQNSKNEAAILLINNAVDLFKQMEARKKMLEDELDRL
jgi:hypothetical protein